MFYFKTKLAREVDLAPDMKLRLKQKTLFSEKEIGQLDLFVKNIYQFKSSSDSMPQVQWFTFLDEKGKTTDYKLKASFAFFKIPANFNKTLQRPKVPKKKTSTCGLHIYVLLSNRSWACVVSKRNGWNTAPTLSVKLMIMAMMTLSSRRKKGPVPVREKVGISITSKKSNAILIFINSKGIIRPDLVPEIIMDVKCQTLLKTNVIGSAYVNIEKDLPWLS